MSLEAGSEVPVASGSGWRGEAEFPFQHVDCGVEPVGATSDWLRADPATFSREIGEVVGGNRLTTGEEVGANLFEHGWQPFLVAGGGAECLEVEVDRAVDEPVCLNLLAPGETDRIGKGALVNAPERRAEGVQNLVVAQDMALAATTDAEAAQGRALSPPRRRR